MYFSEIIIEQSYSGMDRYYTYAIPIAFLDRLKLGMRVLVPFGKKETKTGIVSNIFQGEYSQFDFQVKDIIEIIDMIPFIDENTLKLSKWMESTYFTGPYSSIFPMLPPGKIDEWSESIFYNKKNKSLNDKIINFNQGKSISIDDRKEIYDAILNKEVLRTLEYNKKKEVVYYRVSEFVNEENITSPIQEKVIQLLENQGPLTASEIQKILNISSSPIKTLLKNKGIIPYRKDEKEVDLNFQSRAISRDVVLTLEQERIVTDILGSKYVVNLLHGLTGSGKTEIYIELAKRIIKKGGQVIIMVPEISLTPQIVEKFQKSFSETISILHSRLTKLEKIKEWEKIYLNQVSIVVGVRSAVFAPLSNLELIIIDEEQEDSYGYHNALRYDTREVAIEKAKNEHAKVLLGSATPSINRYYEAKEKKIGLFSLKNRVQGSQLPRTEIVDMRIELEKGNSSIISNQLFEKMKVALERNEQVILFLNRRGYSNFIACRSCGHVIKCDYCDISMNYHKTINRLRCHYCGSTKPIPKVCPVCNSKFIKSFGIGTQQVEEEIVQLFPDYKVMRMDRDTTSEKDSYIQIYNKMKDNEIDILIGTQMLAKGLDFPDVTVVGVLAADLSLYLSDYRAQEKTFQLISQVSGRAGRGRKKGNVVIQTYNPENYSIDLAQGEQYLEFYEHEIEQRKFNYYPPFCSMVTISITDERRESALNKSELIYKQLITDYNKKGILGTKILETPKIKNKHTYQFQIKVKSEDEKLLRQSIKRVIDNYYEINNKHINIDIEFN